MQIKYVDNKAKEMREWKWALVGSRTKVQATKADIMRLVIPPNVAFITELGAKIMAMLG